MDNQKKSLTPRYFIQLFLIIIVIPFLPLLISGSWDWWEAWVYGLISVLGFIVSRAMAAKRNPDLIKERGKLMKHDNVLNWDKILAPLVVFGGGLIPLIAGLDELLNWSPAFSILIKILALALILSGYIWGAYALIQNRFFSTMVRIQSDRGHKVITSGPYRWMRHPGYSGAILTYLATPLFLDSGWAFIPSVLIVILLVVRTSLEDKVLQIELEGYSEYAEKVRYRLFPGVW